MSGVDPPTETGGQKEFEENIVKVIGWLGQVLGFGAMVFTVALISIEVILNPIFLFAQAKANGVEMGGMLSLSWWTVIVVTFATTGLQYALLQPGGPKGIGRIIGWIIAGLDTAMDGAGFAAWLNGGDLLKLSGDSHNLTLGLFPPHGSNMYWWGGYFAICAICLLHEPFLSKVLGRFSFDPAPDAGLFAVNISRWVKRAGQFHNKVKLITIGLAPFIMMTLDVMLFPQSAKGQNGIIQAAWFILTIFITLLALVVWEYWNHISKAGYKFKQLDLKNRGILIGALVIVIVDSVFDLIGFNQIIYNQGTLFPQGLPPEALAQFVLTAGLVMLMCSAFEPMNSDVFGPLSVRAESHAMSLGGGDFGGGGGPDFGGDDDFGGGGDFGGGDDFGGADDFGGGSGSDAKTDGGKKDDSPFDA